jgi:hypothetical protein
LAKGASVTWTDKSGNIRVNLQKLDPRMYALIAATVDFTRDKAVGEMKEQAPWKDRTGNARATLNAKTSHDRTQHVLKLFGGVPYQIWLEIRWAGRYSVISKQVPVQGKKLMERINGLMARLKEAGG